MKVGRAAESVTLIVEPHARGHHLDYVRLLVEDCDSRGDRVAILTTTTAVESVEWEVHLSWQSPEIVLHPISAFELPDIACVSANLGATNTILPDADGHLRAVLRRGWSGPGKLTMLVMRGDVQPGPPLARLRLAKTLVKRALIWGTGLRPSVRVFVLSSPLEARRGPLRWIADPVKLRCSSQQARTMRAQLKVDGGRYWLGVFGDITPRKNLPLILEAIREMADIGLLIAGPIDTTVTSVINPIVAQFTANGGAVQYLGGPLTDTEFDCAIGAVDCVVVAHSNEGPSGVVLKAAASGRRLILAGAKSLRKDADNLGSQATWTPLELEALRRAIQQARRLPEPTSAVEMGSAEFVKALTQTGQRNGGGSQKPT